MNRLSPEPRWPRSADHPALDAGGPPAAAEGILHRHLDLHRLQSVRGRVQGVERHSRATASTCSASSYDNTGALGASTWRHVAFIERQRRARPGTRSTWVCRAFGRPGDTAAPEERTEFRWLMSSDVCKHCTNAGCLDVCPTGALIRTEFGTVVVQDDICNGCGYCVPACPFGVIDRRDQRVRRTKQRRASPRSARSATTGSARRDTGLREGLSDPVDPVRRPRGAARSRARDAGRDAARAGRHGRPALRATIRTMASAAPARSSCCSTSPRCTACRRIRWSPRRPALDDAPCRGCRRRPAGCRRRRLPRPPPMTRRRPRPPTSHQPSYRARPRTQRTQPPPPTSHPTQPSPPHLAPHRCTSHPACTVRRRRIWCEDDRWVLDSTPSRDGERADR